MMKNRNIQTWLFYFVLIFVFSIITFFLIKKGQSISNFVENAGNIVTSKKSSGLNIFKDNLLGNITESVGIILLQLLAILVVSRFFGFLCAKIGQPTVIGEIIAGIVLGPSLLGNLFPEAFHFLFNPTSLNNLYILSQIGLILFMFTVGMELNIGELKTRIKQTFVISQSSIIIPFALGMITAFFIYEKYAPENINFLSFALFIGISMSITAFPVLARIVQERGLTKTHLGTISIGSAAIDDVTAWILLVAVIAIAQSTSLVATFFTFLLTVLYVSVMMFAVRPFLKKIANIYQNEELMNKRIFAFFILILILSSFTSQALGIHALFGAFIAGLVMPPLPKFRKIMIEKIEDLSVTLLLPLFFVYTGLKTEIGLLNNISLWLTCGVLILIAITGKFGGGTIAARISGESWKNSLSLGVLMNTRGLMELVVLNIGLEMGILPPVVFAMLVLMALTTTFMTTPILHLIEKIFPEKLKFEKIINQKAEGIFKAIIALGNPENGRNLLSVAKTTLNGLKNNLAVNVLHITAGTDINPIHGEQFSTESFIDIKTEAATLNIPIRTEYKVSDNVEGEIIRTVNEEMYDFLLIGAGQAMIKTTFFEEDSFLAKVKWLNKLINKITKDRTIFYPGTLIRDKTKFFIEQSNCSVGIFVNRNFTKITSILIVLSEDSDYFLLRYARRILRTNPEVTIKIVDINQVISRVANVSELINSLHTDYPLRFKISRSTNLHSASMNKYSFMMISYPAWERLLEEECDTLKGIPSTLIISKKTSRFNTEKSDEDEDIFVTETNNKA
ncbi:MAG: cation:proton antiporter [Paludibacteraceae bacterium]